MPELFISLPMTVTAEPMSRVQYNHYRGWVLPADENGADLGYMIEHTVRSRQNHPHHRGHISWVTLEVFNKTYRKPSSLTIGHVARETKNLLKLWLQSQWMKLTNKLFK